VGLLTFKWNSTQIQASCKRLKDAYDRKPGHQVPVADGGIRIPVPDAPPPESRTQMEKLLYDAVAWANGLASLDQDYPPVIETLNGVPHVPEAFGCMVVYGTGNVPWTYPAVSDINQVYELKPMKVTEAPLLCLLRKWIDYAQRKIGTDVPFWTMDLQSPFSVAEQVLGPDILFTAMYDAPKALHHLLGMITDYSIEMLADHIAQMEHPGFPGRNYPSISDNIGVCLADDTPLIMLSPDHYREFSLPYNSRIALAFGGLHIHSCGNYTHNLDNLLAIPNVRSIQLHAGDAEFPLPQTPHEDHPFNRARDKVTCWVDITDVSLGDAYRGRCRQMYQEYVLPRLKAGNLDGLILQSCGPATAETIAWVRQQVARA
jgi:hypothetical protein